MKIFLVSLTAILAFGAVTPADAAIKRAANSKMCWTITDVSRLTGYSAPCGSEKLESTGVARIANGRIPARTPADDTIDGKKPGIEPLPKHSIRTLDNNSTRDSGGGGGGGGGGGAR